MVITKAGWGTIAEAVIGNTPLVLIERPSTIEDTFNIEKINYEKLNKYKNQLSKVADYIIN